ncbi:DUF6884 domain-containing protein [Caballeronia concitans]|uniref:DUF6884 domain-containing protein n=1 Tax=Caballeronia concitans TaxID=1777133 RepID=A0A658QT93_9BURK|nr:DUF6884 domain-containing protein [Caballeronia concitans]KIG10927.1 hypothetical protein BurMR1_1947 [Burkholderia sp. MR1]SAL18570.1 hypothetical protein AWB72_01226 [Caballeronia concitans]
MVDTPAVYLVSCVGKKLDRAACAKDLYDSTLFRLARRYVERRQGEWFILSAKYGLVAPDQHVEPYDHTLNGMKVAERRAWAHRVQQQMGAEMPSGGRCVVLAGNQYREFLMDYLSTRFTTEVPMKGLRIGEQQRWLLDN